MIKTCNQLSKSLLQKRLHNSITNINTIKYLSTYQYYPSIKPLQYSSSSHTNINKITIRSFSTFQNKPLDDITDEDDELLETKREERMTLTFHHLPHIYTIEDLINKVMKETTHEHKTNSIKTLKQNLINKKKVQKYFLIYLNSLEQNFNRYFNNLINFYTYNLFKNSKHKNNNDNNEDISPVASRFNPDSYENVLIHLTLIKNMKQKNGKPLDTILKDIKEFRNNVIKSLRVYRVENYDSVTSINNLLHAIHSISPFLNQNIIYKDSHLDTQSNTEEMNEENNIDNQIQSSIIDNETLMNLTKSYYGLLRINKDLKKIPLINLRYPTIILIGTPNVGKSSLVRNLSSGQPEVNDYPFTTRGVTIGHMKVKYNIVKELMNMSGKYDTSAIVNDMKDDNVVYQVMDTPGLLDRPLESDEAEVVEDASIPSTTISNFLKMEKSLPKTRNEMEKLTFASLSHLPTGVIYTIDPTGLSGNQSAIQHQVNIRSYLKTRFPRRPWVDVVTKADLKFIEGWSIEELCKKRNTFSKEELATFGSTYNQQLLYILNNFSPPEFTSDPSYVYPNYPLKEVIPLLPENCVFASKYGTNLPVLRSYVIKMGETIRDFMNSQ